MAFKDTVKEWFKTDLKPSEAQFYNLFNWIRWKDEKIPITDIFNIEDILNAKAEGAVVTNHLTDANAHATEFNAKEDKDKKGAADGYAPLNELVKIASDYLNIVDDLVTGGSTELLSAEQGKVLKIQIDAINTLLASDNVNLDNVQELVDAIETLQISLSTILVNDLTTGGVTKALTAEQGKVLKGLVDTLASLYSRNGVGDLVAGVNDQPYEQRVLVGYQNSIGSNYKHQVKGNTYASGYSYAALGFLAPLFGDFSAGVTLVPGSGKWTSNSKIVAPRFQLNFGYTVATLPIGVSGDIAYVNDALSPLALSPVVGGGTVNCLVMYNGAINQWVALSGSGTIQTQINTINTLLASDDINLDTVQELVNAIKSMQTSLSTILVNDLTTGGTTKALTAEMGKSLKAFIDGLESSKLSIANLSQDIETDKASTVKVGSVKAFYDWAVLKFKTWALSMNVQTGTSYTFQTDDYKKITEFTSNTPVSTTIPNNATTPYAIGTVLKFYVRGGGDVTLSGAGLTLYHNGLVFKKGDLGILIKKNTDTWIISTPRHIFASNPVIMNLPMSAGVPSSLAAGDIYSKNGNLYLSGVPSGSGTSGSFGNISDHSLRSITGLGLDAMWGYFSVPSTSHLLAQFADTTQYGRTSIMYSGYHYGNTLVANGVSDAHPDMMEGAMISVNGDYNTSQIYFDAKGNIYTKGGNSGGWKKFTDSDSGVFYPGTYGAIVCTKSYWKRTGKILTVTINGTANGTAYQEAEIAYPNSYTCQDHTPGRILGASIASVPTSYVQNGDVVVYEGNANSIIKFIVKTPSNIENYSFSVTFSIQIN